jgi:hypothetical protein
MSTNWRRRAMKFGQRLGLGVGYGARLGTDGFTEQGDDARIQPIARGTGMDRKAVDEWVALFDDPILANSALDRFAHRAHQIVMDGPSLRAARAPGAVKGRARAPKTAPEGG